jgi:hypothetical protein
MLNLVLLIVYFGIIIFSHIASLTRPGPSLFQPVHATSLDPVKRRTGVSSL